jgi:hypothetical protein
MAVCGKCEPEVGKGYRFQVYRLLKPETCSLKPSPTK